MDNLPIWVVYSKTKSQSVQGETILFGKIVVPAMTIDEAISRCKSYLEDDGQDVLEIFKCSKLFQSEMDQSPEDYVDIKPSIERARETQRIYGSFYSEEHLNNG